MSIASFHINTTHFIKESDSEQNMLLQQYNFLTSKLTEVQSKLDVLRIDISTSIKAYREEETEECLSAWSEESIYPPMTHKRYSIQFRQLEEDKDELNMLARWIKFTLVMTLAVLISIRRYNNKWYPIF